MLKIKTIASGSSGNCYLLEEGPARLLIECGVPLKKIGAAINYEYSSLDGCLVSHSHKDHSLSMDKLESRGVTVLFTPPGDKGSVHVGHHFGQYWLVRSFEVPHDSEGTKGFFIRSPISGSRIVYISDAGYSPFKFTEVTHFMLECNHSRTIIERRVAAGELDPKLAERILKYHLGLETCIELLKANDLSQVEEIHLLHLSDGNSDAALFKRTIQELTGKPVFVAGEK